MYTSLKIKLLIASVVMLPYLILTSCGEDDVSTTETSDSFIQTGSSNGYGYADLGLSVSWATCNYGASTPSQYGEYTLPIYWGKSTSIPTKVAGSDWDRIRHLMGKNWRLPTDDEIAELKSQCTWTRYKLDNTEGVKVTGPNGNSIFFPITGWHYFDEIPWSNIDGPYLQYSEAFWGDLESNGKFDLIIPYEKTYLRYARGNDGQLYFQFDTSVSAISPLRAVYSTSNPSSGSESGGNSGGSGDHHYPCKSCNESGKCWNCNGTGTNSITHKECNTCNGTGTCQICHGKGYIIV